METTNGTTPSAIEQLGALLSGGDTTVAQRLQYFAQTVDARRRKFGDGEHTDPSIELIDVLRDDHLVYCDSKDDPHEVLDKLTRLCGGALIGSGIRHQLRARYHNADLCIGNFAEPDLADWFAMANECGHAFNGIDEQGDCLALVLIPLADVDQARQLGNEARIRWAFGPPRTQPLRLSQRLRDPKPPSDP